MNMNKIFPLSYQVTKELNFYTFLSLQFKNNTIKSVNAKILHVCQPFMKMK
jgi:hypothetical protein